MKWRSAWSPPPRPLPKLAVAQRTRDPKVAGSGHTVGKPWSDVPLMEDTFGRPDPFQGKNGKAKNPRNP